jgi:hypothetical protein
MNELLRQMQIRMRNVALHHFSSVGQRTLVGLQHLDLFDDPVDNPMGANLDQEVLRDPTHKRRIKLPPGPLLVYQTIGDASKLMLFEVPKLILSDLPDVRRAALDELSRMIEAGTLEVTPKTRNALDATKELVLSSAPHEWRSAAITLTDAFGDDLLVAIQATHQILGCEPTIQEFLDRYVPRVISPRVSSLDTITLAVKDPEKEHPRLTQIIAHLVSGSSNLREACERYYVQLGYLPLAPAYSMAEVVSRWVAVHSGTDAWAEVWEWVNASNGPISRFHACVVFVQHPELIPGGKLPDVWREALSVIQDSGRTSQDNASRKPWALRRGLARHYSYYLEANIPDSDGAGIACFAWWLAERVAGLFPNELKAAEFYHKNWVGPAEDRSMHIWLAASSRIAPSYLRYITATVSSPWATALLAMMGDKLEDLLSIDLAEETKHQFHEALVSCLVGALPFTVETATDPTYAQECDLGQIATKWATYQPEEHRAVLEQLVATSCSLGTSEGICDALRKLDERPRSDQVAVALALKAKAYTDPSVAAAIWDILSEPDWRERVLGSLENRVLGLLVEDFFLLQANTGEKWFSDLPHYLAILCEKCEDEERSWQLFLYVVHSSIASDTVSSIRRLMTGDKKALIAKYAVDYRSRVEAMWSFYPAWVQGRLRAIFSSMQVL